MCQKSNKNAAACDIKSNVTVVLKTDLHCDGCANKVLRSIRSYEGVERASISEAQKITVVGKVDPMKILEKVEKKTHKKVELISPKPNNKNGGKENAQKGKENNNSGGVEKQVEEKEKESSNNESKKADHKSDDKKSKNNKEPPLTTAVLKVQLHCEGCTQKIRKIVTKTKGYQEIAVDKQKDLVTVTGSMDMKILAEALKKHLRRQVEIMPPPKKEGGAEKKENNNNNNNNGKKENNNNNNAKNGNESGDNNTGGGGGEKAGGHVEEKKMQQQCQVAYPYPSIYGSGGNGDPQFCYYSQYPVGLIHAPQLFSDENPNACVVM